MNLDLTDEQLAIQETVREFVDRRVLPVAQENDVNHHLDMGIIDARTGRVPGSRCSRCVGFRRDGRGRRGFVSFDNFSFASTTTINQISWFGIFLHDNGNGTFTNEPPNTSRWDVLINDSTGQGGTPGNLIGGQLNAGPTQTVVGTGFFGNDPVTIYEYTAQFPTFTALAGVTYWISPVSVGAGSFDPFFSWIQGTGGDGSTLQVQLASQVPVNEFVRSGDRAFTLSSVPEPTSVTLLGLGLAGLAVRRRRSGV